MSHLNEILNQSLKMGSIKMRKIGKKPLNTVIRNNYWRKDNHNKITVRALYKIHTKCKKQFKKKLQTQRSCWTYLVIMMVKIMIMLMKMMITMTKIIPVTITININKSITLPIKSFLIWIQMPNLHSKYKFENCIPMLCLTFSSLYLNNACRIACQACSKTLYSKLVFKTLNKSCL